MRWVIVGVVMSLCAGEAAAQSTYGGPVPAPRLPNVYGRDTGPMRPSVARETGKIRDEIRRGRRAGAISRKEARGLRREARHIDTLSDRYGAGGLSDSERTELDNRARALRDLTIARRSYPAKRQN